MLVSVTSTVLMEPVASSMAQKEARHREVVDELHEQIDHIQQERDDLQVMCDIFISLLYRRQG